MSGGTAATADTAFRQSAGSQSSASCRPLLIYIKPHIDPRCDKRRFRPSIEVAKRQGQRGGLFAPVTAAETEIWEGQMDRPSSATGISEYYESLMRTGQQATKQFDDALTSARALGPGPARPRISRRTPSQQSCRSSIGRRSWAFGRAYFLSHPLQAVNLPLATGASRMRPGITPRIMIS